MPKTLLKFIKQYQDFKIVTLETIRKTIPVSRKQEWFFLFSGILLRELKDIKIPGVRGILGRIQGTSIDA